MRSSAGNVKRSQAEIDADPEKEDDYGYTSSKFNFVNYFRSYEPIKSLTYGDIIMQLYLIKNLEMIQPLF